MAVPLRVLILEDEPADAELAVHALRQAGFAPGSPVAVQMPGSRPAASRGTARPPITLAPKKLILTRRASEGSASEPSLARRVSMC